MFQTKQTNITVSSIPIFLENSFRFFECSAKNSNETPLEPIYKQHEDDIKVWLNENKFSSEFIQFCNGKNGLDISKLTVDDLSKEFTKVQANVIISKIKERKRETTFGERILKGKEDTDSILREMYKVLNSYSKNRVIPFNIYIHLRQQA